MSDPDSPQPPSTEPEVSKDPHQPDPNPAETKPTPESQVSHPLERPQERTPESTPPGQSTPQSNRQHPNITDRIMAWSTVAIMLATIANCFIAYYQWNAMENSLNESRKATEVAKQAVEATKEQGVIAKETAIRQLRSYLIVKPENIPKLAVGDNTRILTVLENVGQTPVYDVRWRTGVQVMTFPLKIHIVPDQECEDMMREPARPSVFVGKIGKIDRTKLQALTPSEVKSIKDGLAALYHMGRVCYRDIFQTIHKTDFCIYWKWEKNRLSHGFGCEHGNEAD